MAAAFSRRRIMLGYGSEAGREGASGAAVKGSAHSPQDPLKRRHRLCQEGQTEPVHHPFPEILGILAGGEGK